MDERVQISPDHVRRLPIGTEIRVVSNKTGMVNYLWVAEKAGEKFLIDEAHMARPIKTYKGFHFERQL